MPQGYIRFPHIHEKTIVFVSEDDLWLIASSGGRAERLTAGVNEVSTPCFSPDGQMLAFVGREEGPSEVYVMPALGGPAQRLTFQSAYCRVLGWSPSGEEILYASDAGQFIHRFHVIYAVKPTGGPSRQLPVGTANAISYGPEGGIVLGRNIGEPSRWKRYRGGTVGHLWCDAQGNGSFQRLLRLNGNVANPCWVGERIYFISDHEGIGNIYSCTPDGNNVQRHTDQRDFYARNLSTDGSSLVYHAGADLFLFDPHTADIRPIDVDLPSLRTQRNRKFIHTSKFLDSYALHPQGYAVALTTRGKAFSLGNWEGPVLQHGSLDGVRYRMLEWLNDGKRLVAISDEIDREALVVFNPEDASEPKVYADIEFGRATELQVSPTHDIVAITNHRNELLVVDLESGESHSVDKSDHDSISDIAWSPDGTWLAYSFAHTAQKRAIKLCDMETGDTHFVTEPVLQDTNPAFDPEGKYLYFLGYRIFNPVHDEMQFDRSFPRAVKPYAVTLRRDLRSPFIPEPRAPQYNKENGKDEGTAEKPTENEAEIEKNEAETAKDNPEKQEEAGQGSRLMIDIEGITARALPFPVSEGRYQAVRGMKGKALFLSFPIQGMLHSPTNSHDAKGHIESFEFENQKHEWLIDGVSSFDLSRDNKTLIYRSQRRLRVLKAGDKTPKPESSETTRDTGWLDLNRVKVSVQPAAEWRQMFTETWRLQREHFWTEDMSGVDWDGIYKQYAPLVERVSSRAELSDLLWELQGELGTSHAYEIGGEYRQGPYYSQGFLGVDWTFDAENERYRIARIVQGDTSDEQATSPLTSPGLNITVGDAVLMVNGQRVSSSLSPQQLLVNQARNELQLTIESAESKEKRVITVKALSNEKQARYRDWVEQNRRIVHERSNGKVGYIHIPDMGASGFAEFHRGFLAEYDYPGLLVDVRWNGGGNVSALLLEKLARRRIGYDFPRWGQPIPYPQNHLAAQWLLLRMNTPVRTVICSAMPSN